MGWGGNQENPGRPSLLPALAVFGVARQLSVLLHGFGKLSFVVAEIGEPFSAVLARANLLI